MAHVYEKMTNGTIDLPMYTLSFLNVILNKLETYGFINEGKSNVVPPDTIILPIKSKSYPYCFDGICLIEKTIKRRGFDCRMSRFKIVKVTNDDGKEQTAYSYEYTISKSKKK